MKFSKRVYWDRRNKGFRGQVTVPGSKEHKSEQRKIDSLARKLRLEQLRKETDEQEVKEIL